MNWSLGHIPFICENIEIGTNNDIIHLILLGNNEGEGQDETNGSFGTLEIRNLIIGTNTKIYLGDTTNLSILGNGVIENNSSFILYGYINIRDQKGTTNIALLNNELLSVVGFGGFSVQDAGDYGIHNTAAGVMELEGYSNINSNGSELAKSAIINEGTINTHGSLSINGQFLKQAIKNENNGTLEVKNGSIISVY